MALYERPYYYALIHIITGLLGAWFPIILVLGIVYQLFQYILDVRFFFFEWKVRKGNSIDHTSVKIVEMLIGYSVGLLIRY